ncbi:MAG: Transcription factor Pcc1 [Archaeoglobi archaeon]|nr:Transcription factor Pcc1 [Archaeoglobi archaeon]MDK2781714.1 Transcription factor Pcc1 [Archaeoglobi archaeon]
MSSYRHSARIIIESSKAPLLLRALSPEAQEEISERSSVRLRAKEEVLELQIDARDLTSLRAAFNTWGRLLKVSLQLFEEE